MNLSEAKAIANRIHKYVMDKRKDPVGNQNCLLCVWCSEAQFRDIDILPRPVYSPRDSIFTHIDRGLEIVKNPVKLSVSNITELKKKVLLAFNDARYYCHVNWSGSEGGHEFILLLLTHRIYVMDSQAGLVVPIDSDKGMYYFTDINWSNTFIARMDDKELNKELLYKENSPNKTVEWDTKIDIPYMRKHGMIPDADHTMRDATEKDLEFVTFSELETVGENKNDPKVIKYIKQDAKDSLGHTKIIVVNGEDVGVYQAYATNKWGLREGKKDWWYLAHIYIKPEYRGMGIGTNIIKKDIREHDKILLQVMKSNSRARKLYESLGFKFSQENDHGGIIMRYEKGKSIQESFMDEYETPLTKIKSFFDSMKDFEYGFYADGKKYTGDILDKPHVFDKYHLMSSEEIEQHKVCVCWDACRYEAEWFKNNLPNVEIKTYYCEYEPKIGNTHTWLVFKIDDKWYVFEYTWYSKRGIKEIPSPEALADDYIKAIPEHEHSPAKLKNAKYVLIEYDPLQDKPGLSCIEFMDSKWHNGTLIKTNCKSEEELIDTFEFANEKWKPKLEVNSIQEFLTQETYIAPTDKLIPMPDYPYDKVYMGTSTRFIPNKDVYFVTQSIANASIFSGRDKVYPELRKRGIYQYNLGYSEWGSTASEPLKTVHIIVEKGSRIKTEVPYFEPFEFTATGYIHKINLSKMKDHIYRYDWMTDECEACVAGIDKLDVIKTTKVTITYKVCHEKDRRKLINESYEEGGLFLMDNMNESYVIVDDEDIVQEGLFGGLFGKKTEPKPKKEPPDYFKTYNIPENIKKIIIDTGIYKTYLGIFDDEEFLFLPTSETGDIDYETTIEYKSKKYEDVTGYLLTFIDIADNIKEAITDDGDLDFYFKVGTISLPMGEKNVVINANDGSVCIADSNKLKGLTKSNCVKVADNIRYFLRRFFGDSDEESDDFEEAYSIVDDDGDVVFEAHVSRMTPEQKERHEKRKMHKTAIRNAEKMGFDPNDSERNDEIRRSKSDFTSARNALAKIKEFRKKHPFLTPEQNEMLTHREERAQRYIDKSAEVLKNKRKRVLPGTFSIDESLGYGSTTDASGRKHIYRANIRDEDSVDPVHGNLNVSRDTLHGKTDFDATHQHEVGHMAQYDHGLIDKRAPVSKPEKKSMGLAEDYAFKCAKWFAKKYKSKLDNHDMAPKELHADYLAARKVGFNRVYKHIKHIYDVDMPDPDKVDKLKSMLSDNSVIYNVKVLKRALVKNLPWTLFENANIDTSDIDEKFNYFLLYMKKEHDIDFDIVKYARNSSYREMVKKKLDHDTIGYHLHEFIDNIKTDRKEASKYVRTVYSTRDYRALFIQDMMWLHKGRRDKCSMKYPAWTPEEKKAFMEFYVDEELTKEDVIEMEAFREYMTSDEESYVIVDDEDIVQEADNEQEAEMEDENDESMTIDDQPDIDEDDSDDGEIEPEDISDASNDESEESGESENEDDDEETIDINTMNDPLDDYADDFNSEEPKEEEGEKVDDEMIDIPGFDGDDEEPADAIEKPDIDKMIPEDNNTPEQTPAQPTEPTQTIDIGINVSGFGSDNSPVQNQYDPKEIERLNTLVASENSAIGEYFQASKDTNVDVLRRLFSDIGEEERFHVEQLLFAKSQITGERYIPRDPNIKKEYEELLAMGMNEEDAMNTAADKVGLMRSQQAAQADAVQEMTEICDKLDMIETMIDQDYMLYTIAESVTSFDDVDDAMQTFVEAYLNDQYNSAEMILEAVGNVGDPKPKPPKNKVQEGSGVLQAIGKFFSGIIQNIGNLIGVVVRFIKKQAMIMKQKASWYKNHSLPDIFRKGFNLYFYNQTGNNAGFAYSDAAKYLVRLIYCCLMVAKQTQPPIGFDYGKERMRFNQYVKDDFRPKTLDEAINGIKNIVMTKTKVVINDDNKEGFLKEAFGIGGSADDNNGSGAYEKFRMLLSDFKGAAQAADKLTKDLAALKGDHNSMYFKEDGRATFDKLVSSMKTIVKGFQMFLKCINSDIKTLISLSKAYTEVNVSEDELPTVSNEEVDKLINIAKTLYEDNIAKIKQITGSSESDHEKIVKLRELIASLGGESMVEEFAVDEVYQEAESIPNDIDYKSFVKMSGYDEKKLKNIISDTLKRACLKIINNIKTKSSGDNTAETGNFAKPNENNGSALKARQALKVIKNTMNPEFHNIRDILLSDKYSSGFKGSTKADVLKRKRQELYSKYKNVFNESFTDVVDEEIITEAASSEAIMAANLFKKGNLQYQLVDELRSANINDIGGFATYCEAKKYSEAKVKSLVYAIIIKMLDKIIPRIHD